MYEGSFMQKFRLFKARVSIQYSEIVFMGKTRERMRWEPYDDKGHWEEYETGLSPSPHSSFPYPSCPFYGRL